MDQKILIGGDLYGSEDFDWWGYLWIRRFWLVGIFMDLKILIGGDLLYGSEDFDWFRSSLWIGLFWLVWIVLIYHQKILILVWVFFKDYQIFAWSVSFLCRSEYFDWSGVSLWVRRFWTGLKCSLCTSEDSPLWIRRFFIGLGVLYVHLMILISLGFLYWSEGFDWSASSSYGSKKSDWFGFSLWARRLINPGHLKKKKKNLDSFCLI